MPEILRWEGGSSVTTVSFTKQTVTQADFERGTIGLLMPRKRTHFHRQSMDNPSFSFFLQILMIYVECLSDQPLSVNLQSSGYFCRCHEFLGFLGCGEQSTVECSEHSPHIPGKNCKIRSKLCNLDNAISPIISNLLVKEVWKLSVEK